MTGEQPRRPDGLDPELLSAWIDEELSGTDAAAVAEWVAADPDARDLADQLASVRDALADLPPVEPSPAFRRMLDEPAAFGPTRRRERRGRSRALSGAAAAVVGAVLGWGLLIGAGDAPAQAVAVGDALDAAAVVEADARPGSVFLREYDVPADLADDVTAPATFASGLQLQRAERLDDDGMIALHYRGGSALVSVFERPGAVDWASLPSGGDRIEVGGDPAWIGAIGDQRMLVLERGEQTYVVVEPVDGPGLAEAVGAELPGRSGTLGDRLGRAAHSVLTVLGLRS